MTNKLLSIISEKYPLTEKERISGLKCNGMKFDITSYSAEGLGHVSVMLGKGFFGLMRMDMMIVNPDTVDLPLYSYDRIFAMGNDTLIVELYDTFSGGGFEMRDVKGEYTNLIDRDNGEHWYDSVKLDESVAKLGKKADTPLINRLTVDHFEAYLDAATPSDSPDVKREKAAAYVGGLLDHGGPSTDVFVKRFGKERTAEIYKTLFGVN